MPTPYGEARRLAYFRLMMKESLRRGPVDTQDFLMGVVAKAKMNLKSLDRYVRSTGRLDSIAVGRNYSRFAASLELIKIEGGRVVPTDYSVFFRHLQTDKEFFALSSDEKLGFFFHLWPRVDGLRKLLVAFNPDVVTSISTLNTRLNDEHLTETYVEWLVDLGLVKPLKKSSGSFFMTRISHSLGEVSSSEVALATYAGQALEEPVVVGASVPSETMRTLIDDATVSLSPEVRRGFDKSLISALPVLLRVQLELVKKSNQFFSLDRLVEMLENLPKDYGIIFKWNRIYGNGYIRVGGLAR